MERVSTIKKAILDNNGTVEFEVGGSSVQLDHFGIIALGTNRYVVTIPKETSTRNSNSNKKHFFGDMWQIKLIDDKPTVISKSICTLNEYASSINRAVSTFNRRFKNAEKNQVEILELIKI